MIVDQDAHPPHHLPTQSRHGCRTACHDRQALVPPWTPLAHAFAHSRSDGHQAQPQGLETIPSRSAQCWHLPREARSRLERSVEASIGHVSRAAGCHILARIWPPRLGIKLPLERAPSTEKRGQGGYFFYFFYIHENWCSQPRFCTVGGRSPNLLCLASHPCITL